MKFTSDNARLKHNADMDKSDIEQGYEVVPMDGQLWGPMAAKRLGITNPWSKVEGEDSVEWSD